jgi:hypothetical protein
VGNKEVLANAPLIIIVFTFTLLNKEFEGKAKDLFVEGG